MQRLLAIALLALAGCTGGILPGLAPSPTKTEIARWSTPLTGADQKCLIVWHGEHDNIYDGRVHTGKTCPILIYSPKYKNFQAGLTGAEDWAKFCLKFFRYKHKEEGSCRCDAQLGTVAVVAGISAMPAAESTTIPLPEVEAAVAKAVAAEPGQPSVAPEIEAEIESKMGKYIDLFNKLKKRTK